MNQHLNQNLDYAAMRGDLEEALANKEFHLAYQPVINVKTGQTTSAEVLLRWNHPQWGDLSPRIFLPVAEAIGLTFSLTETILQMLCKQGVDWMMEGLAKIDLSANISPSQFSSIALPEVVGSVLEQTGFPAENLILEIPESTMLSEYEDICPVLQALEQLGIQMIVDDLGKDSMSLDLLGKAGISGAKLYSNIIQNCESDTHTHAVIHALTAYAEERKCFIGAKGIESNDQLQFALEHGIENVQGYRISKPLRSDMFSTWRHETNQWCETC
jgi:EAL domain-containing protein (putative c-di-GMP-specific phosphodiesterase class I)